MKTRAAESAKAIRIELKKAFPQIKFSVTSETFAGGNAVRVKYLDSVSVDEIEKVIGKYQYGHFNGMEDIYEYSNNIEGLPQTKYLTIDRDMSDTTKEKIMNEYIRKFSGCENAQYDEYSPILGEYVSTIVYRKFREMPVTNNSNYAL